MGYARHAVCRMPRAAYRAHTVCARYADADAVCGMPHPHVTYRLHASSHTYRMRGGRHGVGSEGEGRRH
eukprot:4640839-Pyramimonas_sp.AAC.1